MKKENRKASEIYKQQNTLLHRAFAAQGMPYHENKEVWVELMNEIRAQGAGRRAQANERQIFNDKTMDSAIKSRNDATGLSDLTLGERARLIAELQKKGVRLFSPSVPAKIRDWKKGDPDVEYEFRKETDPQLRMVFAMWSEMGYELKTLRGLCFKLFKKDDPRWLNDNQLMRLVTVVKYKAQQKGLGNYYRRAL